MIIRFGYVALALNLEGTTSSGTITYTRFKKMSEEEKIEALKRVSMKNIQALKKILKYNIDNQIHFYRLTSKLIPLASHPDVNWPYINLLSREYEEIGQLIKQHQLRVDTHPDHFNVINSLKQGVFEATQRELMYHHHIFEMMQYDQGKMVLHLGSSTNGKKESVNRFINNFKKLPQVLQDRIILENDDKTYNIEDILAVCQKLKIPMVLDYHHYVCKKDELKLEDHIQNIFDTWQHESLPVKVHLSGPKDGPCDRKHADYVEPEIFFDFLDYLQSTKRDVDIMIESKQKDRALFKLIKDIKAIQPQIQWMDETTMKI